MGPGARSVIGTPLARSKTRGGKYKENNLFILSVNLLIFEESHR